MKFSNLLKYLLSPFFMFAVDDEGGGGGGAGEDRGDTLDAGAPKVEDPIVDPMKDEKTEETEGDGEDSKEDDKKAKKDSRIPMARHKELLEKERAARDAAVAELAKYKQGAQVEQTNEAIEATETKLVALETEYNKLLADGEIDKATAKMSEIRRLERTIGDQKSDMKAQAAEVRAVERVRYDTVVERLEAAFPALNPEAEEFDKDAVAEVLELKDAYELKGLTPSAALQKAVKYVLGAETGREKSATEVTPNVDKDEVAKLRKQEALKRNIAAAKATPASTAKVGLNNEDGGELTAEKAMKMSQEEFAKLDEKTLARMRGDSL
ncbi:hypothetical protein [Herminiimonas sp. CN]|uniref:hypothetical protein n=1 Tax=Herminiimonas sp. CN TaxID=1349818 RepID=UPI0004743A17|nr:hypothetical protein [Herminiimonas sp. CN]